MRTAMCISGQPRNVKQGYEFIKRNIIECNNPDVFIHTWAPTAKEEFINPINHSKVGDAVGADITDTILDLYKPVRFLFEKQIEFDEKDYNTRAYPGMKASWILSMWHSVKAANQLKIDVEVASKVNYDVVIRIRFDWAIKDQIIVQNLNTAEIIVSNDCPHRMGINDQFAVSSSKNMDVYSTVYDYIEEYYRQDGLPFCNEILLKHHLAKNKIKVLPIPIAYGLVRDANKIIWGKQ